MMKHKRAYHCKQQKDCLAEDLLPEEKDVEDDVWVKDDELTVADGQANVFKLLNHILYFFV